MNLKGHCSIVDHCYHFLLKAEGVGFDPRAKNQILFVVVFCPDNVLNAYGTETLNIKNRQTFS